MTTKQVQRLGLEPRSRLSPLLQKCCLRLSANESYQNAELEIEALTGVKVGHSTQQKLVLAQDIQLPQAKQAISEVSVDGGKVRLRGKLKAGCYWRDYKAVRLQGIYYGAFFDENQSLIDYVNTQDLVNPLVCLGDGHDGVWNLVREFGSDRSSRCEILDWLRHGGKSLQSWWLSQTNQSCQSSVMARFSIENEGFVCSLPRQKIQELYCLSRSTSDSDC